MTISHETSLKGTLKSMADRKQSQMLYPYREKKDKPFKTSKFKTREPSANHSLPSLRQVEHVLESESLSTIKVPSYTKPKTKIVHTSVDKKGFLHFDEDRKIPLKSNYQSKDIDESK